LVSETGHVPLLHRTYPGNGSDQALLDSCLGGLKRLHEALNVAEDRPRAKRTVVRDGGFWSEQLELDLEGAGYHSLISLPLSHSAAEAALAEASKRGRMKRLSGALRDVRAFRTIAKVGELERTLVVVESKELLRGQKRGIAQALRRATRELKRLERRLDGTQPVKGKRPDRTSLQAKVAKLLGREHLGEFVVVEIAGDEKHPTLSWRVDAPLRRALERTRLGRRVLCTDHRLWGTERVVRGFRGQWTVEELFRRAKKGGLRLRQCGEAGRRARHSL
jgi:transposase